MPIWTRPARGRLRRQPPRGEARGARTRPGSSPAPRGDPDGRGRRRWRHRGRVLDALDFAHAEIKKLAPRWRSSPTGRQEEARVRRPDDRRGPARRDPRLAPPDADRRDRHPSKLARQEANDDQGGGPRQVRRRAAMTARPKPTQASSAPPSTRSRRLRSARRSRRQEAPRRPRPDEIRQIETEVDVSPRVHGSALFTRGETQILSNVALGTTRMDMRLDTLGLQTTSGSGTTTTSRPSGRGGRLHARPEAPRHRPRRARRAGAGADDPGRRGLPLRAPGRLETLESNGSSSMGSVCASSMALQAAGVPVSAPVTTRCE